MIDYCKLRHIEHKVENSFFEDAFEKWRYTVAIFGL